MKSKAKFFPNEVHLAIDRGIWPEKEEVRALLVDHIIEENQSTMTSCELRSFRKILEKSAKICAKS